MGVPPPPGASVLGVKSAQFSLHQLRKLSHNILSLVLYSARIMLGVKNVQFTLRQGKKVKLRHYFSFWYSISFYLARIMLGVKRVQFSFHQDRKVKLQHCSSRTLFSTDHVNM